MDKKFSVLEIYKLLREYAKIRGWRIKYFRFWKILEFLWWIDTGKMIAENTRTNRKDSEIEIDKIVEHFNNRGEV